MGPYTRRGRVGAGYRGPKPQASGLSDNDAGSTHRIPPGRGSQIWAGRAMSPALIEQRVHFSVTATEAGGLSGVDERRAVRIRDRVEASGGRVRLDGDTLTGDLPV